MNKAAAQRQINWRVKIFDNSPLSGLAHNQCYKFPMFSTGTDGQSYGVRLFVKHLRLITHSFDK